MNNERYTFGGVTLEIRTEIQLHHAPKYDIFLAEPDAVPDYTIEIIPMPSESNCGRTIPAPVERDGNTIRVKINRDDIPGISAANVFSAAGVPCLFVEHDAFILHSSYVLHDGKAILFTAPSGTGKSTQATFWKEHRHADVINGDRTLVTYRNGNFLANGIYASGKSGLCQNVTSPIGAVILLEQGSRNEIRNIPARELFMRIVNQCGFDMNSAAQQVKITDLIAELINSVPVYCYACRNHPDSVDDLERYLWNNKK
ncbi:MAG: hypothetical protein IJX93_06460 [Clostridia bacterium]|nr:hypothetical protein [Clostridia bacterium]